MEKNLKKLSEHAKTLGIDHFALLMKNNNVTTFHFEEMKMSDLMNLMISGFLHVINMEIEKHPEYSFERKAQYGSLAKDFTMMIKDYDKRINDIIKKESGSGPHPVKK